YCLRAVMAEHPIKGGAVADIDLLEGIALATGGIGQGLQVAGIGQLVDIHHRIDGMADYVAHQGRTNKVGDAGKQYYHAQASEDTAEARVKGNWLQIASEDQFTICRHDCGPPTTWKRARSTTCEIQPGRLHGASRCMATYAACPDRW